MEFYPDLARKAAVLAARLINNRPLPDGNERVGYLCALEFVARNGGTWTHPPDDPDGDDTVAMIEGVATGRIDEHSHRLDQRTPRMARSDDTTGPTGPVRNARMVGWALPRGRGLP